MLKRNWISVLSVVLSAGLLFGCSTQSISPQESPKSDDTKNETASKKDWPKGVSIGSATIGGTFHVLMTGWGKLITDKLGVQTGVEVTGGPVNNVQLVNDKKTDIAPVTMGVAFEGYNGQGWATQKYENIRMIFPLYKSLMHWWVMPNQGIESIYDFKGKVVSNGPAGSSPDLYGKRILDELGIKPTRIVAGQFSDLSNQMRDGQSVGMAAFSGVPNPTADEMVNTDNVKILGVPKDDAAKIADKYGLGVDVIPANTYKNQKKDIPTVALWSAVLTHKDLPVDFVYELTKMTFESNQEMVSVHQSAKEAILENVKYMKGVPFHLGAIKYFEEKGIEIPESAYPPEYKK